MRKKEVEGLNDSYQGQRGTNSSYLFVMGALSMFINGGASREGEMGETRRRRTKSRDGEMAQIGLKKRNEPSPLTGRGKGEVDVLEHRNKVRETAPNLPQARSLLSVKEGEDSGEQEG